MQINQSCHRLPDCMANLNKNRRKIHCRVNEWKIRTRQFAMSAPGHSVARPEKQALNDVWHTIARTQQVQPKYFRRTAMLLRVFGANSKSRRKNKTKSKRHGAAAATRHAESAHTIIAALNFLNSLFYYIELIVVSIFGAYACGPHFNVGRARRTHTYIHPPEEKKTFVHIVPNSQPFTHCCIQRNEFIMRYSRQFSLQNGSSRMSLSLCSMHDCIHAVRVMLLLDVVVATATAHTWVERSQIRAMQWNVGAMKWADSEWSMRPFNTISSVHDIEAHSRSPNNNYF